MNLAQNKLTLYDLLMYLRTEALQAIEKDDVKTLDYLGKALDVFYEAAIQKQDENLASVLVDFTSSINHFLMGVKFKVGIPSEEELRRITDVKYKS